MYKALMLILESIQTNQCNGEPALRCGEKGSFPMHITSVCVFLGMGRMRCWCSENQALISYTAKTGGFRRGTVLMVDLSLVCVCDCLCVHRLQPAYWHLVLGTLLSLPSPPSLPRPWLLLSSSSSSSFFFFFWISGSFYGVSAPLCVSPTSLFQQLLSLGSSRSWAALLSTGGRRLCVKGRARSPEPPGSSSAPIPLPQAAAAGAGSAPAAPPPPALAPSGPGEPGQAAGSGGVAPARPSAPM
ncbi:unnamed protein product [Natator depressus]